MKSTFACLLLASASLAVGLASMASDAGSASAAAKAQTASQASGGVYTNCSACHGPAGEGGFAPPFKDNPNLADTDHLLTITLNGGAQMPAFGAQLSDQEIATVLSTIRSMWGNGAPPVTPTAVAQMRAQLGKE